MGVKSKTLMRLAVAAAAMVLSAPAHSALILGDTTIAGVTLDFGGIGPFSDKIKNNNAPDGTTVTLMSDSGRLVDYTGTGLGTNGVLQASGNGDGFAKVQGSNGFIDTLKIDPQGAVGFTAIDFNLGTIQTSEKGHYEGDITLYLLGGGGPVVFQDVLFAHNQNKFSVTAGSGIKFESILFSDVYFHGDATKKKAAFYIGSDVESMRQVSMIFAQTPTVVPEPATWAMMIAGFGLVGGALRRRPRLGAATA